MTLRFLGTRGEIEQRSELHRMHSTLLVSQRRRALLIDCGRDWLGALPDVDAEALVLTHAHADHAAGLRVGCPWPVYAAEATWRAIRRYAIDHRRVIRPRRPETIAGMTVEAFVLEHSLLAPAVGFRIAAGKAAIFYAPDVVSIRGLGDALSGVDLYVGDGAAITRSIIRRRDKVRIGHASIRDQLEWCARADVGRAVFTHCGKEIVAGDARVVAAAVRALGRERGVRASIARDGTELRV